jgi:hypothetical protein
MLLVQFWPFQHSSPIPIDVTRLEINAPGNWPKGSEAVIDRKVKEKILSYLSSYKTTPYPRPPVQSDRPAPLGECQNTIMQAGTDRAIAMANTEVKQRLNPSHSQP